MSETSLAASELSTIDEASAAEIPAETDGLVKPSLYRVFWRWHLYAGLILGPILLVVAGTGALYTFKTQLSRWMYHDLYFVPAVGQPLDYDQQLKIAQAAASGLKIEGLFVSDEPGRTTQFVAHIHEGGDANPEQMHRVFFVDPYAGRLVGTHVLEQQFFGVVLKIHRTLVAGITGRIITELTTSWSLVLIVTGLYLWWPRSKCRTRSKSRARGV